MRFFFLCFIFPLKWNELQNTKQIKGRFWSEYTKQKKKHQVDVFNFCMDILIRFSLHAVSFVLKIPIKYFKLGFVLDFAFQAKIDCWIKNFCIFLKQPKKKNVLFSFYLISVRFRYYLFRVVEYNLWVWFI